MCESSSFFVDNDRVAAAAESYSAGFFEHRSELDADGSDADDFRSIEYRGGDRDRRPTNRTADQSLARHTLAADCLLKPFAIMIVDRRFIIRPHDAQSRRNIDMNV